MTPWIIGGGKTTAILEKTSGGEMEKLPEPDAAKGISPQYLRKSIRISNRFQRTILSRVEDSQGCTNIWMSSTLDNML